MVCLSINHRSSPTCVLFHADADNDKIGDGFDGVVWNVDLTVLWSVANAFHRRRLTRQTLRHHLTCHQYTVPWNIFFRWLIITKRDYYTLSGEVLAWLSVWREVQMTCIWSSWCHCHPIISWYSNIQHKQSHTVPQSFQAFSKSSAGNKCYWLQCFDTVGSVSGRESGLYKHKWWGAGVVICLKQGTNNLHTVQLMSSLASDWFNLSLASLHRQSWKKRPLNRRMSMW